MKYQIHYREGSPLSWRRGDNWYHCMEWNYTMRVIRELSKLLDDSWKLIFTGEKELPDFEGHDPNKIIVFQISDEKYGIQEFHKNVKAVFKHYVKSDCESNNVYPIPQGVMTGFVELPYRKPEDRSIDVFFSGNYHTSRRKILDEIKSKLGSGYNVVFMENNAVSMVQPTYSHYLMDSKVVLDLDGALGTETFRYFEGLAAGCHVVTSKNKPDNWVYNKDNVSYKVDWNDLDEVVFHIKSVLEDKNKLNSSSKSSFDYYNTYFCPKRIANKICEILGESKVSEKSVDDLVKNSSVSSDIPKSKKKVTKKKISKGSNENKSI